MPEETISQTIEADFLFGRLKQLQTRYPYLINDVRWDELMVDVEFYLEDIAIDVPDRLLGAGVAAVHRMDNPRVVRLPLPSLIGQQQERLVIDLLDRFLKEIVAESAKAKSAAGRVRGLAQKRGA
jgi:4-aminobutyrate aminotransferase-like enzyme